LGIYLHFAPQEVTQKVTRICRDYIWGTNETRRKQALVSWNEICTPKKYGGLGMKNLELWNKASIAKLVCAVALEKDM